VIALGVVSFLTDLSSEMIYPLLPVFLTATLGASASMLGVIEGAAESTAALLKLASGWWSDRLSHRKPLVVGGYSLSSLVRPLVAAASTSWQVLAIRVTDRVGKGIRTSPRDALIADSVDASLRGRAYGFHRAADNAGGVGGPLMAFMLMQWMGFDIRSVFWIAFVPAGLAVLAVTLLVKEKRGEQSSSPKPKDQNNDPMPRSFWAYLGILLVFTLGNSTDAFLLLRAHQLGVSLALIPILWASLHVVKTLGGTPGGALSDRIGRAPTVIAGWAVFALVYFGFAFASNQWHIWALFLVYGLYFALTEGAERALVADFAPKTRRGTAFGWFNLTVGLGALPASAIFGLMWDKLGAHSAFILGAALAAVAAVGIALIPKPQSL
jgi:MFS family permease